MIAHFQRDYIKVSAILMQNHVEQINETILAALQVLTCAWFFEVASNWADLRNCGLSN